MALVLLPACQRPCQVSADAAIRRLKLTGRTQSVAVCQDARFKGGHRPSLAAELTQPERTAPLHISEAPIGAMTARRPRLGMPALISKGRAMATTETSAPNGTKRRRFGRDLLLRALGR